MRAGNLKYYIQVQLENIINVTHMGNRLNLQEEGLLYYYVEDFN